MLLHVTGVSKTYMPPPLWLRPLVRTAVSEAVVALQDVSFDIGPGEVVGLVGPNGAGKSTLIRIITTLLTPSAGRVVVDGFDTMTAPAAARQRLGLVLDSERGLYDRLTGMQNLEFFGAMSGLCHYEAHRRARQLLALVGLEACDKLTFGYSSGMRSRLNLARAIISDPPLLVLDEPTRSLDPLASRAFLERLREMAGQGRGVLLSSHRLDEVASVCNRVLVIVAGRVRYDGPPPQLSSIGRDASAAMAALLQREVSVS